MKFSDYLTEGRDLDAIVKDIAKQTDRNMHSVARMIVAKEILKDMKLHRAYEAIEELHQIEGHLTANLARARADFDKKLQSEMKKKLDKETYDKVWGAL